MISTILLVEDDATIANLVWEYLERSGFRVVKTDRGDTAIEVFSTENPNLIILDLNLPGMSGYDVCEHIRKNSSVPILVLSARSSEDDRVRALELGADDYVGKPFSARELVARVQRHLARSENPPQHAEQLLLGTIRIEKNDYTVYVKDVPVRFTKTEFEILARLAEYPGQIVERKVLMNEIIGYDHYLSDRTIDTHIKNIRKKLESHAHIETVRGVGYRLTAIEKV